MENKIESYFGYARTALKYGLNSLDLHVGDGILVPDYICDVVYHPIKNIGLNIVSYPVTDAFIPEWKAIKKIIQNNSVHALFLVHYFGQPQNIDLCRKFCVENNIYLIEDNSHGHGGYLNGKLLGTFGDIGISSPRKIVGLPFGGILFSNMSNIETAEELKKIHPFRLFYYPNLLKIGLSYFPKLKGRIKGWLNYANDWSNPLLDLDEHKKDFKIGPFSLYRIESTNWSKISYQRRSNWEKWSTFASNNGLNPIYLSVHPESCPWAIPVYAKNLDERNHWLKWGSKNGVNIFPWPTLREETINEDGPALARWKRLLCFPLDISP